MAGDRELGAFRWSQLIRAWNYPQLAWPSARGGGDRSPPPVDGPWTLADALTWISFPYLWGGQPAKALELAAEGEALAAKVGHVGTQALAMRMVALACATNEPDLDRFDASRPKGS